MGCFGIDCFFSSDSGSEPFPSVKEVESVPVIFNVLITRASTATGLVQFMNTAANFGFFEPRLRIFRVFSKRIVV